MIAAVRRWWSAPCGGRDILRIAFPLIVSTGFFSLTLFVDRMFLFWYSPEAMAASMPAGNLHWVLVCFPLGLAQYANTFVAQYYGANRPERIGAVIWQSVRIGIYAVPFFLLTAPLAPALFRAFGHVESMVVLEAHYFQLLLLAAPATVMCGALSSFFTGRGETKTVMYVNFVSTIVNIVLDYLWVFGKAGFPVMGITGAALATAAANWSQWLLYLWLMHRGDTPSRYGLHDRRFDAILFRRILRFGSPNGLQYLVESGAFTIVLLQVGQLGGDVLAATTVAFNVNLVAFIPLMGISIAVSTLVGQQLTQTRSDLAVRATWSGIAWALAYSCAFGIVYLFFPHWLMAGHAAGVPLDDAQRLQQFHEIRDTATILLRFVAAYCLFDALQIVFVGAIKGAGDTWFVLVGSITMACLALALGWAGEVLFDGGLYWWWTVITIWIFSLGVLFGSRFVQGRWKSMRVIEPQVAEVGALNLQNSN